MGIAASHNLDLVEVAAGATPPVCRVMDYSKHLYEESQKLKAAKRNTAKIVVKEIKFRPAIDKHDYETKRGHVERFLRAGEKVKVTVMFRGREQSKPELGRRLLATLSEDLAEIGVVESQPVVDGRNMVMMLAPRTAKTK